MNILKCSKIMHNILDILEIDWKEVKVTFNEKAINLPRSITIKLQYKFKVKVEEITWPELLVLSHVGVWGNIEKPKAIWHSFW